MPPEVQLCLFRFFGLTMALGGFVLFFFWLFDKAKHYDDDDPSDF